jgi:tetratricopeptide (TPR) repeat protein
MSLKTTAILLRIFLLLLFFAGMILPVSSGNLTTGPHPAGYSHALRDHAMSSQPPDTSFQAMLLKADSYLQQKNYALCQSELEKALKVKPNDAPAKEKLLYVKGLIAQEKKNNEEYRKAMTSADAYFASKDYLNAKAAYQLALNVRPGDTLAGNRMKETMELLRSQKASNILYDVTVASADKLFAAGDYDKAMKEYENASKILPDAAYPKEKINEIIKMMVDIQVRDELYATAISRADKFYEAANYQSALTEYQKALKQKPGSAYPSQRVEELTGILKQLREMEEAYKLAIGNADAEFAAGHYPVAREGYSEALRIKPKEVYPANRIREIDRLLAEIQRISTDYGRLIEVADSLYMAQDFSAARQHYQLALQVKPNEPYPAEMMRKSASRIQGKEAEAMAVEDAYRDAVSRGDRMFLETRYDEAKRAFTDAGRIKPAEQYPKDKLAEIGSILAGLERQQALEEQYASAILTGDSLFSIQKYAEAKASFNGALRHKPSEEYPKQRIGDIDKALQEISRLQALDKQYADAVAEGDRLMQQMEYASATEPYQRALELKPGEIYPKDQIILINQKLAGIAEQKELELLALDKKYNEMIVNADKSLSKKQYETARQEYTGASRLKPEEQYPKDKLAEIGLILNGIEQEKALDERFASLIKHADSLFSMKQYEEAKNDYTVAVSLKPAEEYPARRIGEIDNILKEIARLNELDAQYNAAVKAGDRLRDELNYTEAISEYQKAQVAKPAETYPKEQIARINARIADKAKQEALDQQYQQLIAGAEKLFAAASWTPARTEFEKALGVKPEASLPKERILQIDSMLRVLADQKALDNRYSTLVAEGDKSYSLKKYTPALEAFREAARLKPAEQYPQTKIAELENLLNQIAAKKDMDDRYAQAIKAGDSLFAVKSYTEAKALFTDAISLKPAEEYPKGRVRKIDEILAGIAHSKALDEQYAAALVSADSLLEKKQYNASIAAYQQALTIKPGESYPQKQVVSIQTTLAEIARQTELDKQYQRIFANAERYFNASSWEPAKAEYMKALDLKPEEAMPKERIGQIDSVLKSLADQKSADEKYRALIAEGDKLFITKKYTEAKSVFEEAGGMKPGEQYPKSKLVEIDGILAELGRQQELEREYSRLIASGDSLFGASQFEEAKTVYQAAVKLKPAAEYPRKQLAEIDKALQSIARQKAIDQQFAATLASGEQLFEEKKYEEALTSYRKAEELKPEEIYPKNKIREIQEILNEIARLKDIDEQYRILVTQADRLFSTGAYDSAKALYTRAGGFKPEQAYWKDRVNEIDRTLEEIRSQNEAYQDAINRGEELMAAKSYEEARDAFQLAHEIKPSEALPGQRIVAINKLLTELLGKKQTYDKLILSGDQLLAEKEYIRAKESYSQASGIFPEESYPRDKISWITATVDSIYKVNKGGYDKAVADGDKFFANFDYDKAIDAYLQALTFLPMEKYPKEMIIRIRATISENAIVDILDGSEMIEADEEKKFSFEPVSITSRRDNFIYLKVRNPGDMPVNVLLRYGRGDRMNGGTVVRSLAPGGELIERLISVKDQDPWYREDNNWISLYPQGGRIEAAFIQISRAIK